MSPSLVALCLLALAATSAPGELLLSPDLLGARSSAAQALFTGCHAADSGAGVDCDAVVLGQASAVRLMLSELSFANGEQAVTGWVVSLNALASRARALQVLQALLQHYSTRYPKHGEQESIGGRSWYFTDGRLSITGVDFIAPDAMHQQVVITTRALGPRP
jgi:hypothetical protein